MTYDQIAQALPGLTYSDETLREIILFFRDLEAKLGALGATWSLARYQCYRELANFERYASARDWDLNTLTLRASRNQS